MNAIGEREAIKSDWKATVKNGTEKPTPMRSIGKSNRENQSEALEKWHSKPLAV